MKTTNKKPAVKSGNTNKKFYMTPKRALIAGVAAVLVLTGVGYWAYSALNLDDANAGGCISRNLRKGSSGSCVVYMQQMINSTNQSVNSGSSIDTDGSFGSLTKKKVVAFQNGTGLTGDGVVGPRTWSKLCNYARDTTAKSRAGC